MKKKRNKKGGNEKFLSNSKKMPRKRINMALFSPLVELFSAAVAMIWRKEDFYSDLPLMVLNHADSFSLICSASFLTKCQVTGQPATNTVLTKQLIKL